MATSPIYSWPEPDNTDLVKNGALAIRTMGDAIDTTMGTMTPKSTFSAKGSIAAATAASTPANLSVGANGTILMADSTAATGIKWDAGTYTTFSPASYTNFVLGNGTAAGRYRQSGKTVFFSLTITFGTTSVISGSMSIQLPISANTANNGCQLGLARIDDTGTGQYTARLNQSGTNFITVQVEVTSATYGQPTTISTTVPHTWASTDVIYLMGTYEAA